MVEQYGYNPDEPEYTEQDLESFILPSSTATYFEKAQDFKQILKLLRIKYLGLRPVKKPPDEGNPNETIMVYQRDKKMDREGMGINDKGVEFCIRFLEVRLGKHIILSSWSEERMFEIMKDDMDAWFTKMVQNMDDFDLKFGTFEELRVLVNDLLEAAYRRPVDDLERKNMRPESREDKRLTDPKDRDAALLQNRPKEFYDNVGREDY